MNRVLVTGATGFIGLGCLPRLLERGYQVHAVSSRALATAGSPASGGHEQRDAVEWHQADLMDAGQTAQLLESVRPTHLLHLAWSVVPGGAVPAGENLRWV